MRSDMSSSKYATLSTVLILVLMEYALRLLTRQRLSGIRVSLNPCSNGICAQTLMDVSTDAGKEQS